MDFASKNIFYFVVALFILDAAIAVWVFFIKNRIKKLFGTSSGALDLEKTLSELRDNEVAFESALKEIIRRVGDIERELPSNLRRVGLVRFNPFSGSGTGGDQSFALALLNEQNNGIVISSIYGREMSRVYAKLIEGGKSKYQLTAEEQRAIEEAK